MHPLKFGQPAKQLEVTGILDNEPRAGIICGVKHAGNSKPCAGSYPSQQRSVHASDLEHTISKGHQPGRERTDFSFS
jgi:hypothetical protein